MQLPFNTSIWPPLRRHKVVLCQPEKSTCMRNRKAAERPKCSIAGSTMSRVTDGIEVIES